MRPGHLLFYLYAGAGVPGRFKSIFYQSMYQTPSRTGMLIALEMLASIPAIPFFGHLSDRLRSRSIVIHLCQVISVLIFLLMVPVKMFGANSPDTSFLILSALASLFGFFYQPLFALGYTMSVDFLSKLNGDALKFATERLWGCVGYAALTAILGVLLDFTSLDTYAVFISFVVCAVLFSASVVMYDRESGGAKATFASHAKSNATSPLIDDQQRQQHSAHSVHTQQQQQALSLWDALKPVMFDGGIVNILFYLLFLVQSAGMALVDNFLFLFMTSTMGASHSLCGCTILVSLVFEMPVFLNMPTILRRVQLEHAMVFAACVYSARVIGYTVVPHPWMVLLLEPLHGIMFGTIDAASVAYVAKRAVKGGEASAQSILASVRAAGFTIATIGGGVVIDYYGPTTLYRMSAAIVMATATCFLLADTVQRLVDTRRRGYCDMTIRSNNKNWEVKKMEEGTV